MKKVASFAVALLIACTTLSGLSEEAQAHRGHWGGGWLGGAIALGIVGGALGGYPHYGYYGGPAYYGYGYPSYGYYYGGRHRYYHRYWHRYRYW